jgi:hypothetical protein
MFSCSEVMRMNKSHLGVTFLGGVFLVALTSAARAQVPVIGNGVSAFSPEISVVNSGVLQDVQATVSSDRRYVTLTMRPQNSQLLNLFEFTFQTGAPVGFVGGVNFPGGGGGTKGAAAAAAAAAAGPAPTGEFGAVNAPMVLAPGKGAVLLRQRGMTRVVIKP